MYLVVSYKYTDYKIYKYTQELDEINIELSHKIEYAKDILENKNTKAYKNNWCRWIKWSKWRNSIS